MFEIVEVKSNLNESLNGSLLECGQIGFVVIFYYLFNKMILYWVLYWVGVFDFNGVI